MRRTSYTKLDGETGEITYPAVVPQAMDHADGFTLLCFNSWEDVNDQKLAGAITNVAEFHLGQKTTKIGFHNEDAD